MTPSSPDKKTAAPSESDKKAHSYPYMTAMGMMSAGWMSVDWITNYRIPTTLRHFTENSFLISCIIDLNRLFGFVVQPYIAWKSDRVRTRFGRRRPFLMVGLPCTLFFLILLGIFPFLVQSDCWQPKAVENMKDVVHSVGGTEQTIALKSDGTVWFWGRQWSQNEKGKPYSQDYYNPTQIRKLNGEVLADIQKIHAVRSGNFASTKTGELWTWGKNDKPQLGHGIPSYHEKAIPVHLPGKVTALTGGIKHTLALMEDGRVWACGENTEGQLGIGKDTTESAPAEKRGWFTSTMLYLSGYPADTNFDQYHTGFVDGIDNVVAVASGDFHSVALKADGTVWAWGNYEKVTLVKKTQRLNETTMIGYMPKQVEGLNDMIAIAAGSKHNLALKKDGSVWTWGFNKQEQLGRGVQKEEKRSPLQAVSNFFKTTGQKILSSWKKKSDIPMAPAKVAELVDVESIAAGGQHSVALKKDGSVWTWGWNNQGQLGDGNTSNRKSPIQVAGVQKVNQIGAGVAHTVAVKEDGSVWTWGWNLNGRLGNGFIGHLGFPLITILILFVINLFLQAFQDVNAGGEGPLYADSFDQQKLGRASSFRTILLYLMLFSMSFLVMGWADTHESYPYFASGALLLMSLGITIFILREKPIPLQATSDATPKKEEGYTPVQNIHLLMSNPDYLKVAIVGAIGLMFPAAFNLFLSLFATEILNMSHKDFGLALAPGQLVALALAFPGGYIVDRFGPKYIIGVGFALAASAALAIAFFVHGFQSLLIVLCINTIAHSMHMMAILPMIFQYAPKNERGKIFGLIQMIRAISATLISPVIGFVVECTGDDYRVGYIVCFCLAVIGIFVAASTRSVSHHKMDTAG